MRIPHSSRVTPIQLALSGVFVIAAVTLGVLATRVRDWIVMTDELQYAKLATAVAQGDLLPALRGQHVSSYAQVYPVLLAPLYGSLSPPAALTAVHVLNALVFASAAIPAYLLARSASLPRAWALAVAVVSVGLPWNVLTGFVLTESVAYAVFLWTMLAMHRSLVTGTDRSDAAAILALAVAFCTRTQFVVLALVFPVAVVAVTGTRALRRRVLVGTYAAGALVALVLYATGGVARLLGRYAVTATEGSILPWRAFEQAGAHLDVVAIGIGLVPLVLGGAWLVVAALRREPFAVLAAATIVTLTLTVSSYDVRFGDVLRDRDLFYRAPLLFVALARALRERVAPAAVAGAAAFVAVTVLAHDFEEIPGLHVDSPAAVLGGVIADAGGAAFVALAAIVLAMLAVWAPPRARVAGAAALVVLVTGFATASAWSRLLTSHGPSGRPVVGVDGEVLDWADRVLPDGARAGQLAYATEPSWALNALLWWDVEFWNRSVDRSFVLGDTWEYAPFPNERLEVDEQTGRVRAASEPPFVIAAQGDARLRLAGARVAQNYGLDVIEAERPYRAEWVTKDLYADGWLRSGTPATIRVFPAPGASRERAHVEVRLEAPRQFPVGFRIVGTDGARLLRSGEAVTLARDVCVASGSYADLQLVSTKGARIAGLPVGPEVATSRAVGPRVVAIGVARTGEAC